MSRKFYWGLAILIVLLIAGSAYLIIPKHTATQPADKVTAGGHWHTDATGNRVWHAAPHAKTSPSDVASEETEAEIDADIAQLDTNIAKLDADIAELDAKYEVKAAYIKHLEAEAAKRKALEKEADALVEKTEKFNEDFMTDAIELLPFFSMSYDDFHNTFKTVAARREIVAKFAKIEAHRKTYRDLIENTSPDLRKMIYARMKQNGMIDIYKRVFLPDEVIKDATLKAIIAEHAERPNTQKGR